jgi:hypothetical protein
MVLDGEKCNATVQCKNINSYCASNGTFLNYGVCSPVIGMPCDQMSDCDVSDLYEYNSYNKYDCNCNRRCYLLNPPTPVTVYTPTPPTPNSCQKKIDAWDAIAPRGGYYSTGIFNFIDKSDFENVIVPNALKVSAADQAVAIDLICCLNCRYYNRFTSKTFKGYQLDCSAKTLIALPDTCDDSRNNLAFLSCWSKSSAATTGLGVASLVVAALSF